MKTKDLCKRNVFFLHVQNITFPMKMSKSEDIFVRYFLEWCVYPLLHIYSKVQTLKKSIVLVKVIEYFHESSCDHQIKTGTIFIW